MVFRKRRRPTPHYKVPPPFNPITGETAELQPEGNYPYCAMMQVAEEDTYDSYVICRGYDTRIAKFIDYEQGNPLKPGISVAKLYGHRGSSTYDVGQGSARKFRVGEIFPAFLPAQGTGYSPTDAIPNYTPPSPTSVLWRTGQNPGSTSATDVWGGHPENLTAEVSSLYDHNGKAVNWMFIHVDTERHFRFQSQEDMVGTSVEACVRQMNGEDAHLADVHDPDQIFLGMEAGTKGICFFQEGKYYIVIPKCEPDALAACE